jgi:hypothetical protein
MTSQALGTVIASSAHSVQLAKIVAAISGASVASLAGVSAGTWPSRIIQSDGAGTLIHGLHRGRLPAVEVYQDSSEMDKRGYWGGVETLSWRLRCHVGGREHATASSQAHRILRGCLAALRADPLLRHGSATIGPMQAGVFGWYVDAFVPVLTMYCESDYAVST